MSRCRGSTPRAARQAGRRQGHAGRRGSPSTTASTHLSTGDLFRAQAAQGTRSGSRRKRYMDTRRARARRHRDRRGRGVPRAGGPLEDGFVLDGFPRTLRQAEELEQVLDRRTRSTSSINIDVPTEIVLDRIAGRRVCESCGASTTSTCRRRSNWTCDTCGGEVVQRDDDTEEAVDAPPRALRERDRADHRLLPRAGQARGRRRRRRRRRGASSGSIKDDRRTAFRTPVDQ